MTTEAWSKSRGVTIDERIIEVEPVSGAKGQRPRFLELWDRLGRERLEL